MNSIDKCRRLAINRLVYNSRSKSKRRSKLYPKKGTCNISYEFIVRQMKKQNYRCYYSNIRFSYQCGSPYKLSLERLDDDQGYTEKNTVLICQLFNIGHGRTFTKKKFNYIKSHNDTPLDDDEFEEMLPMITSFAKKLFRSAKSSSLRRRASKTPKSLDINITLKDIVDTIRNQRGLCAYSDIRMSFIPNSKDWMASLERIDPKVGYIRGNICVTCLEFNDSCQLNREMVQMWRSNDK